MVKKIKKIKKEGETDDSTSNENEDKDDAARAKPYQSAWLRSPLKYLPESVKNAVAMDQIWEIVEVSATLPNEQGMGVPGKVDLLKKDPTGTVKEFRTVDGKGIGVVVDLSDGSTSWFFEDEITAA